MVASDDDEAVVEVDVELTACCDLLFANYIYKIDKYNF